ncbi:MAG: SurA N-terminal domain-containing protein [Endomicrobiaceae bacterium]|nr:SurA N-terminal domain-containing protein [Endomicrobiaceae bacterium]MDD3923394.1 SurA N-terminal domain-containing protein [Endomicrobiaceae bacterium]
MKKFLVSLCFIGLMFVSGFAEEVVDNTLAIVNGEPLMSSEFNKILVPIIEQQRTMVPIAEQSEAKINELKNKVLEQKVEQMLLIQEAKKAKIKIPKREIEEAIAQVKKRFPSDKDFASELKKEGLSQIQFEKRLEEQLMSMKLVEREMKSTIKQPTEDDVKNFYNNVRAKMKGEKLNISAQDEETVDAVAKLLKRMSAEQIRVRQIFIKSDKNADAAENKAALARVTTVKKELAKGASFADLSEKYSEDQLLRQRKGDMGLVIRGDLTKELETPAFTMNVGQYTKDAIRTDSGYHFLRVEERKASTSFSFDDVKKDLAEVLYQQNGKKAYDKWISDLKAKANIKINKVW